MAFADAIFDGLARLGDVLAKRARDPDDLPYMVRCGRAVPVSRDEFSEILALLRPDVLVDARMRKRHRPERQIGVAPLTIGLGPNFIAGETTDIAVETGWGDDLGRVIPKGSTRPLQGEPSPIAGVARERYVYSPAAGILITDRTIGERVMAGTAVAAVGHLTLSAPISGCIRGLTHDGARVEVGTKVIEIDPRNDPALVFGLGDRPRTIASSVLSVVNSSERLNL
jgi:xanthine dehydrogenase accessory factor